VISAHDRIIALDSWHAYSDLARADIAASKPGRPSTRRLHNEVGLLNREIYVVGEEVGQQLKMLKSCESQIEMSVG
jgi:hypothetical protein